MENRILITLPADTLYAPLYLSKIVENLTKKKVKHNTAVCCWNPLHHSSLRQLLRKRLAMYGFAQFLIFLKLILFTKCYAKLENFLSFDRSFNIKKFCKDNCISYMETDSVNSSFFIDYIRENDINILISIAIGEKFSQKTIDCVTYPLNVHSSLLPKYRGIMGLFWAHLNNDDKAGVSVHRMVMDFDAGAILGQCEFPIDAHDSLHRLYLKAINNGSKLMADVIESILNKEHEEFVPIIPKDSYRSFPQKKDITTYRRQKKYFFRMNDIRIYQI